MLKRLLSEKSELEKKLDNIKKSVFTSASQKCFLLNNTLDSAKRALRMKT